MQLSNASLACAPTGPRRSLKPATSHPRFEPVLMLRSSWHVNRAIGRIPESTFPLRTTLCPITERTREQDCDGSSHPQIPRAVVCGIPGQERRRFLESLEGRIWLTTFSVNDSGDERGGNLVKTLDVRRNPSEPWLWEEKNKDDLFSLLAFTSDPADHLTNVDAIWREQLVPIDLFWASRPSR